MSLLTAGIIARRPTSLELAPQPERWANAADVNGREATRNVTRFRLSARTTSENERGNRAIVWHTS